MLGGEGVSDFAIGAGTIVSGAALGGLSEELAGGSFWDGVRNGAISASLNHVAHMVEKALQDKANQRCCKTHAEELAKYGQVIGFGNVSISGSYGAGLAYEEGTIDTDKGWEQRYRTFYSVAGAGISFSSTGGVIIGVGNNEPTFSDWRGLATGGSVSYLFFGAVAAKSTAYYALGGSLGLGYGVRSNWNGTFSYAWTFLIGNPYPRPPVDFSRSYINTQKYLGGN